MDIAIDLTFLPHGGRVVATVTDPDGNGPRAASGPMSGDPRSRAQRRRDTVQRLSHDTDVWVASASADGTPYLVPLSFDWDAPRAASRLGVR